MPCSGDVELKRAVAAYLYRARGIDVDPRHIVIGAGAEYLYGIIVKLLGRDKLYAVENPGYGKIAATYRLNGAEYMCVNADISSADRVQMERPDAYERIEDAARQLLEGEVHSAIEQAVMEDGCDIFGFGRLLYRKEPDFWREQKESWPDLMKECRYQVSASVKVRRLEQENRNGID